MSLYPASLTNGVFSHDVTAAMLVSQNNETAAFCFQKHGTANGRVSENALLKEISNT